MKENIIDLIEFGDRVTILSPNGIGRHGIEFAERTGTAVIRNGSYTWILNMGGKHGRPAVATSNIVVRVRRNRKHIFPL